MGLFDRLANLLGLRRKEVNVLVVGLNNSGKSTVINNFKREDDRCIDIVPTVGYNVEKFSCRKIPILFLANKMDLPDSLTTVKLVAGLGLDRIQNKPWHIRATNAITGEGLQSGIEWLTDQIRDIYINKR